MKFQGEPITSDQINEKIAIHSSSAFTHGDPEKYDGNFCANFECLRRTNLTPRQSGLLHLSEIEKNMDVIACHLPEVKRAAASSILNP